MSTFILIVILIAAVDQWTKDYARKNYENKVIKKKNYTLRLVKNKGAFKGLLKNRQHLLFVVQTVAMAVVILIGIVAALFGKRKVLTLALAFISGGAIGNWIDRYKEGEVTDFIALKWTRNLYYNIADFSIFIGAILIVIQDVFRKK